MPPEPENDISSSRLKTLKTETTSPLTDDVIQVDDKLYSTTALANFHPGGDLFVKAFGGRDATEAFLSYHRREFPHSRVAEHLINSTTSNKVCHLSQICIT